VRRVFSFEAIIVIAVALYGVGVWLHIPYGGGRIYSDIVTVFQSRECSSVCSWPVPVPYIQAFVEYPIGTAFFMYAMALLGSLFPGQLLTNYYILTSVFLLVPTLLLIRELRLIAKLRGTRESRLLWFFIVTPTFLFMLLLNWYVIGTYFAIAGIRLHLEGKRKRSGLFLGLSAASNLVTAAPAFGLLLSESKPRNAAMFIGSAGLTYVVANLPVYLLNPANWLKFWNYQYTWYIEGSWLGLFVTNTSSLRHVVPPILFTALAAGMLALRFKHKVRDPVLLSCLGTFGFIFSTYVYTPQMNVLLLPFFALLPMESFYAEFLAWDLLNSLIIVVGFSGFIQLFGINYSVAQFGPASPIQLMGIARSFWLGKFVIYNGLYKGRKENENMRERSSLETDRLHKEGGPG
jgi:hypothetical protein